MKPNGTKTTVWRHRLGPVAVTEGMNAALRNAKRLLQDANALFQAERFPSSTTLAILAIEEHGKIGVLQRILLAKSESQLKLSWKDFTSHTAKNNNWVVPNLFEGGATNIEDFRILADKNSKHPYMLDDFKMWSLYTECRAPDYWSEPALTITRKIAEEVLSDANRLITYSTETSVEQQKIYYKHMFPVWPEDYSKGNPDAIRSALIAFATECVELGLSTWDPIAIEAFLMPKTK